MNMTVSEIVELAKQGGMQVIVEEGTTWIAIPFKVDAQILADVANDNVCNKHDWQATPEWVREFMQNELDDKGL